MNEGFGKDFYRKGNSVKRFGAFTELPDSETEKSLSSSSSQKISSYATLHTISCIDMSRFEYEH